MLKIILHWWCESQSEWSVHSSRTWCRVLGLLVSSVV